MLELICRPETGGWGRPVVIVSQPKPVLAFGVLRAVKTMRLAVHEGEQGDRPVVECPYRLSIKHRKALEESCVGKRERGEL